ncbi:hypothetical protein DFH08DRAFT_814801 [Mycena albidolilacea]|uniref:Uncharacterized protein n=1 Tax=Mycena albidolilacea TaxID=1033008 RepID=A0AAD6ZP40_9AGAR|nr:hypothetical protein DFH08DRAFT_814801 [Mycena albidolilacea]
MKEDANGARQDEMITETRASPLLSSQKKGSNFDSAMVRLLPPVVTQTLMTGFPEWDVMRWLCSPRLKEQHFQGINKPANLLFFVTHTLLCQLGRQSTFVGLAGDIIQFLQAKPVPNAASLIITFTVKFSADVFGHWIIRLPKARVDGVRFKILQALILPLQARANALPVAFFRELTVSIHLSTCSGQLLPFRLNCAWYLQWVLGHVVA